MRKFFVLSLSVLVISLLIAVGAVQACGPWITFRAYLDKRFWQPFSKYEKGLERAAAQQKQPVNGEVRKTRQSHPFAGTSTDPATALSQVRDAYRRGEFEQARSAMGVALQAPLSDAEKEELALVEAKITLRQGGAEPRNKELLREAQTKLRSFLAGSRIPAWQSEARGWLARTHYLLDEYSRAAKIYLDELQRDDSVYSRDSLIASLRLIFPYNGSGARLADHLDEYFDTPGHALFVVNIVTNPIYNDDEERAQMAGVARKTIDALLTHRELFNSGPLSDQLALALMRAALYRGDTRAALSYSRMVAAQSPVAKTPEFNWMVAASHFLQREYRDAEAPLLGIIDSGEATARDRNAAAQGLIGVYQKTGRRVEQLHAAFLYEKYNSAQPWEEGERSPGGDPYVGFNYWPLGGELFDLPYLLDVQLTDGELLQYLEKYAGESRSINVNLIRRRTANEMARYALAVRYARQEKYQQAAAIYEQLRAMPRARRTKELAGLHAAATNQALAPQKHLEAQYAYAVYLEAHSTQVFFNDMVWSGFQTWSFIKPDANREDSYRYAGGNQGLTRGERERYLREERRIRDEQEERWRAYKILNDVVEQAGHTDLGRRAAAKALRCLELINTERFGRSSEINAERKRLRRWQKEATPAHDGGKENMY